MGKNTVSGLFVTQNWLTLEKKLIAFYRTEDVMGIMVSLNREDEMVKSIPIDCM